MSIKDLEDSILADTSTDDEVLYYLMASAGKLCDKFSQQQYDDPYIEKYCDQIIASANILRGGAAPAYEEDQTSKPKGNGSAVFFNYKEDTDAMRFRAMEWLDEHAEGRIKDIVCLNRPDRNGNLLIGVFDDYGEAAAFFVCYQPQDRIELYRHLKDRYN